jgi:hypothetical protein
MEKDRKLFLTLQAVNGEEKSGFSRGHITVSGDQRSISSTDGLRDQSMMIFLSIVQLMDGIRRLSENSKDFNFVGDDSSFQFFIRVENEMILIKDTKGCIVGKSEFDEFIINLWKEINGFVEENSYFLSEEETVCSDLRDSIGQFKETFKL